jgi:hypothetical protein
VLLITAPATPPGATSWRYPDPAAGERAFRGTHPLIDVTPRPRFGITLRFARPRTEPVIIASPGERSIRPDAR